MWLYIPGLTSCPSAPEWEPLTSESAWPFPALERSALLRSKPSASRNWYRGWKKVLWIKRLCGRILKPSMAAHGAAEWIASLEAIPVSRSVPQACGSELTTPGTSSLTLPQSFATLSPSGVSSKTSPAILTSDSLKSPESYKAWATTLRRDCLQRRKLAQATDGSDSSSWPTARASDIAAGRTLNSQGHRVSGGQTFGANLSDTSESWPTPTVQEAGRDNRNLSNPKHQILDLADVSRLWGSPTAHDGRRPGADLTSTQGANLSRDAALWGTPTSRDWKDGASPDNRPGRGDNGLVAQQALSFRTSPQDQPRLAGRICWCSTPNCVLRSHKRKLNSLFTVWLMGWPLHWMAPEPISYGRQATGLYRWKLRLRLACLLRSYWSTRAGAGSE
jgi:hypothetical protein